MSWAKWELLFRQLGHRRVAWALACQMSRCRTLLALSGLGMHLWTTLSLLLFSFQNNNNSKSYFIMWIDTLPACLWTRWLHCPQKQETRRGHWILYNQTCRLAAMWVLGFKPDSSGRAFPFVSFKNVFYLSFSFFLFPSLLVILILSPHPLLPFFTPFPWSQSTPAIFCGVL